MTFALLVALSTQVACMTPDLQMHRNLKSIPVSYEVAILPFTFQGSPSNPHHVEKILRKVFFNYFSYLAYRDMDLATIDKRLQQAGYTDPLILQSIPPDELKKILKADAVIFGQVHDTNNFTGGLYAETRIEADMQMVDLNDGQLVWELEHHEMEVSGVASPTLVEIIQDQIRNSKVEKALIQSAESFSLKAVAEIPEPSTRGAAAIVLPRIDRINANLPRHGVLRPGDILQVELFGEPGLQASFDIGDRRTAVPMTEVSPGHYQGAYQVQVQDQFQGALIIGRLKNDKGWTRKRIYKSHSYPTNT